MSERNRSSADKIREGNDLLRKTLHPFLGKVILTRKIANHPDKEKILETVRTFNEFNENNDPHGEHDCAFFEITSNRNTERYCFKIDYYDSNYEFGADPYVDIFKRVITIMHSSDY